MQTFAETDECARVMVRARARRILKTSNDHIVHALSSETLSKRTGSKAQSDLSGHQPATLAPSRPRDEVMASINSGDTLRTPAVLEMQHAGREALRARRIDRRNRVGARPENSARIDLLTLVILDCGFNDVVEYSIDFKAPLTRKGSCTAVSGVFSTPGLHGPSSIQSLADAQGFTVFGTQRRSRTQ